MRSEQDKARDKASDATNHLAALADEEGWLAPPPEISRIKFSRWQQAVFWGLRVYIVIMLVIMGWGFYLRLGQ